MNKIHVMVEELPELETEVGIAGSVKQQEVGAIICLGIAAGIAIYMGSLSHQPDSGPARETGESRRRRAGSFPNPVERRMIVGEELKAWIRDRDAQRATQAGVDAFGHDWGLGPVHRRFDDAMASLPAPATAEQVAEAVRALFADTAGSTSSSSALAAQDARRSVLRSAVPQSQQRHPFRPARLRGRTGLDRRRRDQRRCRWRPRRTAPRGATSVGFSGQLGVFRFVKAGGATLSFWEAPPIAAGFTAADAGTCRRTGERADRGRRDPGHRRPPPILCGRGAAEQLRPAPGLDRGRPGAAQRRI